MIDKDIVELLESESRRINNPDFIADDPVQFPRRFDDLRDIEITAFLSAIIAWGRRAMICRDAQKMLDLMQGEPYWYVMERGYEDLDESMNIHRTFFARDMAYFMRGLRYIYERHSSLDAFSHSVDAGSDPYPACRLVAEMQKAMQMCNDGVVNSRCLPSNLKTSALKRVNMALRWLVRDDGIVDMGVWKSIDKSRLYIPLDVHVGNTARSLGLLTRNANDRRSVEQLTQCLREIRPDDPVIFDYALFGIGVEGRNGILDK